MVEQVKLFWNYTSDEFHALEDDINDFIAQKNIIDVKIQSYSMVDCEDKYMAIIRYEEE